MAQGSLLCKRFRHSPKARRCLAPSARSPPRSLQTPGKVYWARYAPGQQSVSLPKSEPSPEVLSERLEARRLFSEPLTRLPTDRTGSKRRRDVLGPPSAVAFLMTAVHQGQLSIPWRTQSAPAPRGPPSLCDTNVRRSTPQACTSTGIRPNACDASTCSSAPCA